MLIDLSKFAKVNLSPFSLQILGERNSNVAADREIFCGDAFCQKLKWEAILTRIDNLFPGKLLCLHVCKTSLDEVRFSFIYVIYMYSVCTLTYLLSGNCWFYCGQDGSDPDKAK